MPAGPGVHLMRANLAVAAGDRVALEVCTRRGRRPAAYGGGGVDGPLVRAAARVRRAAPERPAGTGLDRELLLRVDISPETGIPDIASLRGARAAAAPAAVASARGTSRSAAARSAGRGRGARRRRDARPLRRPAGAWRGSRSHARTDVDGCFRSAAAAAARASAGATRTDAWSTPPPGQSERSPLTRSALVTSRGRARGAPARSASGTAAGRRRRASRTATARASSRRRARA